MPEQFVVPQFLDVETKIIGPVTGRQFLIMLATVLAGFTMYRLFRSPYIFIPLIVVIATTGITFAFAKVNGQPFHNIALNMLQTLRRPAIRVWDKSLTDAELRDRLKDTKEAPPAMEKFPPKRIGHSRLSELSLVVNTGGAYEPEGDLTAVDPYGH